MKRGFTLIELLIVCSLLAFLSLIGMSYFRTQIFKGNDARRKSDLKKIQIALEEYEKDNDCYPTTPNMNCSPGTFLKPYLNKIPCDYRTDKNYKYDAEAGTCPKWYRIFAKLENSSDPDTQKLCLAGGDNNFYIGSSNAPRCPAGE